MIVYLTADTPCHLKVNGEYLGIIDKNLYKMNGELNALYEFLPVSNDYFSVYGTSNGGENLKSYSLLSSKLLYPVFNAKNSHGFKMLGQKTTAQGNYEIKITALIDGQPKFYLDGALYDVKALPFIPTSFDGIIYNNYFLANFSQEKTALFVYDLTTKKVVLSDIVDGFIIDKTLTTRREYNSVIKSSTIKEYSLDKFYLISKNSDTQRGISSVHKSLKSLAFFESVIVGADCKNAVTPSLYSKIDSLKEFLGKIIRVLPSPFSTHETLIIYEDKCLKGTLEYDNTLITNVLLDDF